MMDRRDFLRRSAALAATLAVLPSLLKRIATDARPPHFYQQGSGFMSVDYESTWISGPTYKVGDVIAYRGPAHFFGDRLVLNGDQLVCTGIIRGDVT